MNDHYNEIWLWVFKNVKVKLNISFDRNIDANVLNLIKMSYLVNKNMQVLKCYRYLRCRKQP